MPTINSRILDQILGIPNTKITKVEQNETEIHFYLEFTNESTTCPNCGAECDIVHEEKETKTIRDMQVVGRKCFLHFTHRRFKCSKCNKTFMERLEWVDPYERLTQRYAKWLSDYGLKIDVKNLSKIEKIGYSTVERVVKNNNYTHLFPDKKDFPINAGMDEFSQKKGRGNFCVLIANNDTKKPFDILPSRDEAILENYFSSIPEEVREKNKSFTIDMWKIFIKQIKKYFPNSEIIIDRFHVMKCLNKCIDKTRRRLQKLIAKDRSKKLKDLRWVILKNNEDLTNEEKEKLKFAFECSQGIKEMYELKEGVRAVFQKKISKEKARKKMRKLLDEAKEINDKSIKSFIKTYNSFEDYILNYFDERKSNGLVEGINNKIKLIKRMAYGMPNFINFSGRILATFSCNYSQI